MKQIIGYFLGAGLLRPAPGTWGSLAALPFVWVFHVLGGPWLLAAAILAGFFAGLWAVRGLVAEIGEEDPSEIVIDEVVGMWIALLPVSFGAWAMGADVLALYPGWIAAFLGFRLFDIWKPWLVGRADRRGDPMGVMLDDVWAGVFAGVLTLALAALSHGVLMR
ncbi:MAG: phosphatidylglycerophosphatase A [Rhodobacterales bacterium]|nr:MAG: phosphatidylglycerophosphatase A [Rhodobacterales bacterium]